MEFEFYRNLGVRMKFNESFIKFLVLIGSGVLAWLLIEYYMLNF
ncbi:hypothetical protein BCG9842_0146 (plasmid) [Bacillus cereus G9842]|uniref:Uncharacterized protein n=1 Tax=Bacillus cereus (strain G9842) TaxID=405531 RepID=B7IYT7_BACC2|nr:hypothetical protein BCG9842_0146 [Bacillus cereus G9842]